MKNLSDALPELIGLIAERLDTLEDCLRFGAVCKTWQSVVRDLLKCNVTSKTLPWVMFSRCSYAECEDLLGECEDLLVEAEESCDEAEESCDEDEEDDVTHFHKYHEPEQDYDTDAHSFFSLSADRYYELYLPEAFDSCFSGSPYGWIVLRKRPQMEIFNPVTHARLPLPPLTTIEGYETTSASQYFFARKVEIAKLPSSSSAAPANDGFIVFAIFDASIFQKKRKPAYARPGDKAWTLIDIPVSNYEDILLLNNQVYVIDEEGIVKQFDMISQSPVGEYALDPGAVGIEVDEDDEYRYYLVDILGELYMVVKIECYDNYCTEEEGVVYGFDNQFHFSFKVFKLDLGTRRWKEVFTLGDYAIFVGRTSFSLLVSGFPESKSCIYFTDHDFGEKRRSGNAGVFKLGTKQLKALVFTGYIGKLDTPPFWFIPNFS